MSIVTIERKIFEKNDSIAARLREELIRKNIFSINLISSPGAGKTSIIERTAAKLKDKVKMAVIEADIQTDLDAQRIDSLGIPVIQIMTNGSCHLDASLVKDALGQFENNDYRLLIIENVGNLVCPAEFDLGESMKVVISSTTEGEDKPLKYPLVFSESGAMIINKTDLLPYLSGENVKSRGMDYSIERLKRNALMINPGIRIFGLSCLDGSGFDEWCDWLLENTYKG